MSCYRNLLFSNKISSQSVERFRIYIDFSISQNGLILTPHMDYGHNLHSRKNVVLMVFFGFRYIAICFSNMTVNRHIHWRRIANKNIPFGFYIFCIINLGFTQVLILAQHAVTICVHAQKFRVIGWLVVFIFRVNFFNKAVGRHLKFPNSAHFYIPYALFSHLRFSNKISSQSVERFRTLPAAEITKRAKF